MYKHFFKRLMDIVLSFLGIIILALPMLIIAIVVKCDSKGPALFKQKKIGKNKKHFTMLKFRSMYTDAPPNAPTHELNDPKKWITKVGGFLRKTSLDELPQIFNIFVGQMSIIGPRPAIWNQYELIDERDKYGANDVRPGLTGLAQISGRDVLAQDTQRKAWYDGEYVKKITFWGDLKIFFKTIGKVLGRADIVEGDTVSEMKAETEANEALDEVAVAELAPSKVVAYEEEQNEPSEKAE